MENTGFKPFLQARHVAVDRLELAVKAPADRGVVRAVCENRRRSAAVSLSAASADLILSTRVRPSPSRTGRQGLFVFVPSAGQNRLEESRGLVPVLPGAHRTGGDIAVQVLLKANVEHCHVQVDVAQGIDQKEIVTLTFAEPRDPEQQEEGRDTDQKDYPSGPAPGHASAESFMLVPGSSSVRSGTP